MFKGAVNKPAVKYVVKLLVDCNALIRMNQFYGSVCLSPPSTERSPYQPHQMEDNEQQSCEDCGSRILVDRKY